ncbi:unannotated protein [freshwater metagenome]|uniref:Unannotated protein n=1 Tax=freshwater metagenome TaxID=449393 RepID=A0A6J7C8V1_9ZZZZ|nr:hypothetical protein [Actinomycetota bacterium]MSX45592.1 hypothetical protein [Actinomycetota bacterium]MSX73493.1 hypothetical protein [Actinomycetota bacterium]MSZ01299.1 hypothetical protein [Actinomycetota bacterium]MTA59932.1 hypothetical protein [Actinomycetota bacterium]
MNQSNVYRAVVTSLIAGALLMSVAGCSNSVTNVKTNAALLSQVQSKLAGVAPLVKASPVDLWWISPDGYSIINDNSPGVEAQFPGCVNDDSYYSMWKTNATKVITAVDEVMLANKFKVDSATNSSTNLSDDKHYDYIKAYFRGETKAVLAISPDCGSTMQTDNPVMYYSASFGYTNDYQKNYASQSPFLIDLKLKDVIVHIQKTDGEFRLLAVNYRRSGHATIVKRVDGKWTEVWSGQDLISCAVRDSNKIPLSMAPDCYQP